MDKFGLDIKLLVAQVVNFLIFFFVFKKFIAKPFADFVANEKKKEHEREKLSKELEESHVKMLEEEKKWKKEVQQEKEIILAETKKVADQVKADATTQAKKEAEEMISKAEKQIKEERATLYNDIKKRTVDLSTYIVEKGLKAYLTDDARKNVTQHIINNPSLREEAEKQN